MTYPEDDLIMLSALQHYIFCERQCALIHIEQVWEENLMTAEGRIMHERVHEQDRESREDVRIEYGLPLRSLRLGLIGKADVVEFHRLDKKKWQPFPVEYKRGKPKVDHCDLIQLSLRFYYLGSNWQRRVEHVGTKKSLDQEGPLIV